MIRKVAGIYFSPVGGTASMIETLAARIASGLNECSPEGITTESYDLLSMEDAELQFDEETIAVIGMPVYVGKAPLPGIDSLNRIRANGTMAVIAVSYGGRTYGNALYELQHHAEENGFKVIGAGAFGIRYKNRGIFHRSPAGKMDSDRMNSFCNAAAAKIRRLAGCEIDGLRIKPAPVEVAGKMPVHRISKLSPRAAAAAQGVLERLSLIHRESEWYL